MTPIIHREHGTTLAEVCHIRSQNPAGPRFDSSQAPEQRHAIENLVLMCGVHHRVIDATENLRTYSVARLLKIKSDHESRATQDALPVLTPSAVEALLKKVRAYSPATHMDFRDAKLSAGGKGGKHGGAGGGGGVINIVGVTPTGFPKIDLDGKKGKWPGGGGGGGGA